MKDLFNKADSETFIDRVNKLTPSSKPLWGKMNAAQMMAHCTAPLKMAAGEIETKRPLISYIFGPIARKKVLNPAIPFDKNLPTANDFKFPDTIDFEAERTKLIAQIRSFSQKGAAGISGDPHFFFGRLTAAEWNFLQAKHLDHHLQQFGV